MIILDVYHILLPYEYEKGTSGGKREPLINRGTEKKSEQQLYLAQTQHDK